MLKSQLKFYPGYFQDYVAQVSEDDLITALTRQRPSLVEFFSSITEEKSLYAYGPDKWTIRGVLQHLIDAERIFSYRALRFARKDHTALNGWEEVDYGNHADAERRNWQVLIQEFDLNRQAIEHLFQSFSNEMLLQEGTANKSLISVATIGFVLIGHAEHHKKILMERYL